MKLIKVSKSDNAYEIQALISYEVLGIPLPSKERSFTKHESDTIWYNKKSQKKVSEKRQIQLNKWLKDHQKFIEKNS